MRKPRKPNQPQPSHEARELERLVQDPAFRAMAARLPGWQRASLWLVVREAYVQLRLGRPCDFCPAERGDHLRFIGVPPGAREGPIPIGVMIVCGRCVGSSHRSLRKKFQAKMRGLNPDNFIRFHDRPTVLGPRVGGVEHLPPRAVPKACGHCGSPMWCGVSG